MKELYVLLFVALARANPVPNRTYTQVDAEEYTTPQIIQMDGYPAESHYLITEDGAILNIHRIPHGKSGESNGKVIYLQHGLLCSSSDWIITGPEKALGYILADEGYDVWLGNYRGNVYSRNHTTYNPDKDSEFWQFSWHELGIYDIPATIDYILSKTSVEKIYYVGHSMGSTAYYVMGSEQTSYMDKVHVYVHLAPVAFMSHMTSPLLKLIAFWDKPLEILGDLIGLDEFVPGSGFLHELTADICATDVGKVLCENVLFAICGFNPDNMNMTLLPTIMQHIPAGASTKELLHYAQSINKGFFRQYDHGLQNIFIYGSLDPPDYDLSKVTTPGHLIYSSNDWLSAEIDVNQLYGKLGNGREKYKVSDSKFNHMDYLYGINSTEILYNKVVEILAGY